MATVRLVNVSVDYTAERAGDSVRALDGVDFTAGDGAITTIVGPSGAGKSTLLRLIAGLEEASGGELYLDGEAVTAWPPGRRDVAMSFQRPALFPGRTALENIAFGLRLRGTAASTARARVQSVARILELEAVLERRVAALSGGEQQRVALGRALVHTPRVFLLDEPLSQLDAPLRRRLRSTIRRWQRESHATLIAVTHNQTDALAIGDQVVMMEEGKVIQAGTPEELYRKPINVTVARFVGSPGMNLLRGTIRRLDNGLGLELEPGQIVMLPPEVAAAAGDGNDVAGTPIRLGFRAEDTRVVPRGMLCGRVVAVEFAGARAWLTVAVGEREVQEVIVLTEHPSGHRVSGAVSIDVVPTRLHLFETGSPGVRLGSVPQPST